MPTIIMMKVATFKRRYAQAFRPEQRPENGARSND
jgi:hypothetical protein